ncbi:MAG TPA: EAL domain-containing protein, partial [Solirubrobacteraceae bacterium]|nr:EAL domain-containing protein [Solirubrobacteraceae bacterium]
STGARLMSAEEAQRRRVFLQAAAAADGEELSESFRIRLPSGEVRTIRARAALRIDQRTGHERLIGTVQDITAQARLQEAQALLSQVVQSATSAIYTLDPNRLVTSWNPACERLFGYTAEEMVGSDLWRLIPDQDDAIDRQRRDRSNALLLSGEIETAVYEVRRVRKDGVLVDVEITWSALRDSSGEIVGTVVNVRDITDVKRDAARVAHLATHDGLTGLLNRNGFEEELEAALAKGAAGTLVMLDLDNFKYVNEAYGHKVGDALVAELAVTMADCLRGRDVMARLGGDEFCVLVPGALERGKALADRLLEAVRDHVMVVGDTPLRTTASIGVISFGPRAGVEATALLADADRAMYTSKEAGRDRITLLSAADRERARQSMMSAGEHLIRDALAHDRFELFVQPIVNLATGMMTHCEVLLRLRSATGELIMPGEFLPGAERLGLIHLIDFWVIERAIMEAARHPDLTFEINLSGATIDGTGVENFIGCRLQEYGVEPSRIVFELTETAAVNNLPRARELAASLSELGCRFAIDDFGAGFSTFYYLKHFPAMYVKIDGEFMNDPHSRMDELVIESIVRIGRAVGKLTIAEYVSDAAALDRARSLGVDYGQGYFFSKPFPIAELADAPRKYLDLTPGMGRQQPLYVHMPS